MLLLISGLTSPLISGSERPGSDQIHIQVARLNAETPAERRQAREQLSAWAERFPRTSLSLLVEAYAETGDPETEHQLRTLLKALAAKTLFYQPRAFLGVNFELGQLPDGRDAVRLISVVPGSPADQAGLRAGDYLLEVGEKSVEAYKDDLEFAEHIQSLSALSPLTLRVLRKQEMMVEVVLGVRDLEGVYREILMEEDAKIEAWLLELRPPEQASPDQPVGNFSLD